LYWKITHDDDDDDDDDDYDCVFGQIRDEEMDEVDRHLAQDCQVPVAGGSANTYGKVNSLLQTYISRAAVENFCLISDQSYVAQV